jgi:hypothetical protein
MAVTTTRTHFTYRIDTWTPDGESIVEHIAGVEDYQVALATFRAACERWPGVPITLRQGARVIEDSRRLRLAWSDTGRQGGPLVRQRELGCISGCVSLRCIAALRCSCNGRVHAWAFQVWCQLAACRNEHSVPLDDRMTINK